MATVAFFDFLSHAEMHLPFNEGYLKVLRSAFPDDDILCAAAPGHVTNLRTAFAGDHRVRFETVQPLTVTRSGRAHEPWWGRPAAERCWTEVHRVLGGRPPRLAALGGMDANLLAVFRQRWAKTFTAPLHYVLHNHLAAARRWRTRNPLLRPFDFLSVFSQPLPKGQSLVALEIGISQTIEEEFAAHRGRIITFEHPVLETEWAAPRLPEPMQPLRVGFTGHCGRGKGFDLFVQLADRFAGRDFEFYAIGRANSNASDLDLSRLARAPAPNGLDRPTFLEILRKMDLVCLPVAEDARYVASGSIIDAFAAAKPLLMPRNKMLRAIENRHGTFGPLVPARRDIISFFEAFDRTMFQASYEGWSEAILRIRQSRTAPMLAQAYRRACGSINASTGDITGMRHK